MYNVYKYIRMMFKKKVIVDCDGGTDDAVSLVILLNAHKQNLIELTAITCVAGNTDIENVVKNVFRILELCEIDVPVYKGANSSLISIESVLVKAADFKYHGNDGFGDVLQKEVNISNLKKEHAVIALQKIITDHPDQVSVVCLGPLTNIALAVKIYPEILDSVKDFYVMGGNSTGLGNTTSQAEFNFYADPESVHMFLQSNTKPLWIFPWETCLKTYIPMDWRDEISSKAGSREKIKLITEIEDGAYKNKDKREYYCPCDGFCAAAVVNSSVIKRYEECHMDVELHGIKTRGQSVIDHLKDNKPNVLLVNEIDVEEFKTIMFQAFQ
ncbi:inosine-uridine preferring nucleoside hydrolase-like [Cotesia glomerata]|nr:inosine-uridine preferring nucleoside hydrolase-like [Cotesia glomerata]